MRSGYTSLPAISAREKRRAGLARTTPVYLCMRMIAALSAFLLGLTSLSSQSPGLTTIAGKVTNASGAPVSSAVVKLEHAGSQVTECTTDASGSFTFPNVSAGEYTVIAESAGLRSTPRVVNAGEGGAQPLELVMGGDGAPADAMEFADDPKFTVAAVTDWTAAGGHGSDAVLRTSEALNRETITLKSAQSRAPENNEAWRKQEAALRAAQAAAPDSFAPNHQLGEFYLSADRPAQAVPFLQAAYKLDPKKLSNERDLARALISTDAFTEAREHIAKLGAPADSADVHRLTGELEEKLGDPLKAVHEFEQAARLDPSEENYFAWGSELLLHRAVWQARDVFAAGVKSYPRSARMLTALGAALFAGALYDQSAETLCAASDLNPGDPEPYAFMGRVEISAPNPLPCVERKLASFAAQNPKDALANYYYAMALWKQKGPAPNPSVLARVEELLTTAVKLDPGCSAAWLQLGISHATQGDYRKAIDFYSKAIAADSQMSEAHYRLGIAYDRVGDKEKSQEQLRLHDEIEKAQAAAVEKQRREVKQFQVLISDKPPEAGSGKPQD